MYDNIFFFYKENQCEQYVIKYTWHENKFLFMVDGEINYDTDHQHLEVIKFFTYIFYF